MGSTLRSSAMSRKIENDALEWAALHATRDMDAEERAAFDVWFGADPRHQGAYLRARALQHSLEQIGFQEEFRRPMDSADALGFPAAASQAQAAANDAQAVAVQQRSGKRRMFLSGALAAGLASLGVLALRRPEVKPTMLATAKGEFRKVPLPDASVVNINSESSLELRLTPSERRIALTRGEAYFDVAKDRTRPFIVSTGSVHVRAVGTAFAVRRYSGGAEVFVAEGVVEVWAADGSANTRMTAGARAFVANGARRIRMIRDPGGVERRLAWRTGELALNNDTLGYAVDDFNRYNARRLVVADPTLRSKRLVGTYRLDQPDAFARDVQELLNVPVTHAGTLILIGAAPQRR